MRRLLSPDGVWLAGGAQRKSGTRVAKRPVRGSTGHTEANAAFLAQLAAIVDDDTPPDVGMTPAQAELWRAWQDKRRQAMGWVREPSLP